MSEEPVSQGGRDELIPSFLEKPEEITEFIDSKEYDVVIVGAGTPGIPCALSAIEEGLNVAVLQKGPTASACGNICAAIDSESSKQSDIDNLVSHLVLSSGHRAKREVISLWARESGKAFDWLKALAEEAGCQINTLGNGPHQALKNNYNYDINFKTLYFGPKPYNVGIGMVQLAKLAEQKGVDFYYETPAVQLIQDESGKVTGVVGQSKEGAIKFNSKLGVVMATGDYQNDPEMVKYYCPDMQYFETKKFGRTGDGHKMVVWAGGKIENITHTKMCHDFDSGPSALMNMPLMRVKRNGKRFANEEVVHMEYMNNYLFSKEDAGHYFEIFDSVYEEKFKDYPGKAPSLDELKVYMPEEDVEREGVIEPLIATYKADTLEELAQKLGVDAQGLTAEVERYNKFVEQGADEDFGKNPKYLTSIDTPPYYGTHRHVRLTMMCSGVEVNGEHQCLDVEGNPIENLYAIGNVSGRFYGSIDYPLDIAGLNLGHNFTEGYYIGKKLAGFLNK